MEKDADVTLKLRSHGKGSWFDPSTAHQSSAASGIPASARVRTPARSDPTELFRVQDCRREIMLQPAFAVSVPFPYKSSVSKDVRIKAMSFATVTSKGQTTIPKEVRDAAGLNAGDTIHFTVLEDGTIIVRVKNRSIRNLTFTPKKRRRVSVEQMNR